MIANANVILRPPDPSDANTLRGAAQSGDMHRLTTPFWDLMSETHFEQWLSVDMSPPPDRVRLVIAPRDTPHRPIGVIDLNAINWVHRRAELGIAIFDETHRGQGFGSAAIAALTEWAFATLGIQRVEANVFETNIASIKAFIRAGFSNEGTEYNKFLVQGQGMNGVRLARVSASRDDI